jgi:hypothetical protein
MSLFLIFESDGRLGCIYLTVTLMVIMLQMRFKSGILTLQYSD